MWTSCWTNKRSDGDMWRHCNGHTRDNKSFCKHTTSNQTLLITLRSNKNEVLLHVANVILVVKIVRIYISYFLVWQKWYPSDVPSIIPISSYMPVASSYTSSFQESTYAYSVAMIEIRENSFSVVLFILQCQRRNVICIQIWFIPNRSTYVKLHIWIEYYRLSIHCGHQ